MLSDAEAAIRPLLHKGEQLAWSGKPRGGIRLDKADVVLVPLSLIWGGFALFWSSHVLSVERIPMLFAVLATLFLLLAAYVTVGRFFADWMRRAHTYYAITDRRVIIARGWLNRDVRALELFRLHDFSIDESRDGSGSIGFDSTNPEMWSTNAWSALSGRFVPGFERVEHVRGVSAVIAEKQRAAEAAHRAGSAGSR